MRRIVITSLAILGTWALTAPASLAAVYLKIEGIEGEAKSHAGDWITIYSMSFGADQGSSSATGAARQRASATPSALTVIKTVDSASPEILRAVATGKVLPKVTIKFEESGKTYIATMNNVQLTGFEQSSDGGEWPREQLSFSYQKIAWEYTDGKGKTSASWDVKGGH